MIGWIAFAFCLLPLALLAQVSEQLQEGTAAKQQPSDQEASDKPAEQFIRVDKAPDGEPRSLDTAIVRYTGRPGSPHENAIVDLVGVVHIGDAEYYQTLQARLAQYDVVLYELVAPDGTRIRPEDLEARRGLLASMQTGMKDVLKLEYQLEKIDYLADNFRHADMSPDEFIADMEKRGDSILKMAARMMGAGLATQASSGSEVNMLMAMFSKDRAMLMKQAMAEQLTDIDAVTAGMDDASGENTLIKGRNIKALKVLKEELENGNKHIAIFYGAGHLDDMAERLESDFSMKTVKTDWLQAWDLQRN
ncbi:MAG: hypothetical protein WD119_03045 [Pirellulaceae bacterium]